MAPAPAKYPGSGCSGSERLRLQKPATDSDSAGETDRQLKIEERQTDSNSVGETDRRLG